LIIDSRSRSRSIGVALATLFVLAIPVSSFAQEASEVPAATAPATEEGTAFPATLGGQLLEVETFTGPEWLAQFSGEEALDTTFIEGTEELVEGLGKTIDDLSVTTALYEPSPGNHAVVAAFKVNGTEARDFVSDAVQLMLGDVVMPELVVRPVAGKYVLRVVDAEMPGVYPRTVYLKDDTAWVIEGDEEYVWDALDQLPGADPIGAMATQTLISQVPLVLDGRRRTVLIEATEPQYMPTLSQRFSPELETWLLDLYLEEGISPAAMIGALSWWGIESEQESIQIEGYQLPGAPAEFVERLLHEVILAETAVDAEGNAVSDLPEGVTRVDGEIAGREVATLDFGPSRQHVFASGDTVWVVTDHVGESEMAEEAIAALP
jgi:hypothetical protein